MIKKFRENLSQVADEHFGISHVLTQEAATKAGLSGDLSDQMKVLIAAGKFTKEMVQSGNLPSAAYHQILGTLAEMGATGQAPDEVLFKRFTGK